jgi:hypothetical protein
MPVNYQIDKANAIIRTECVGDVTLEEVVNHFRELARDPNCPERLDVLLDLRGQSSIPENQQLRVVTSEMARVRGRVQFGACAIVAPRDALYGMLRVFQVFTEAYFREAQVFRTLEEAEQWLAAERAKAGGRELDTKSRSSSGR